MHQLHKFMGQGLPGLFPLLSLRGIIVPPIRIRFLSVLNRDYSTSLLRTVSTRVKIPSLGCVWGGGGEVPNCLGKGELKRSSGACDVRGTGFRRIGLG